MAIREIGARIAPSGRPAQRRRRAAAAPAARPAWRGRWLALVIAASVGACSSYDPPSQGDHTSQHYQDDLQNCRRASREAVRLQNAATPGRWIISPITGPPAVRAAIRNCMQGKGYVLEKTSG
ncbi:MAG TPA: hypothetical protein VMB34_03330 [Acetobacteraceae bacterium]|nr:hypothetical protein [Acetobacteraceae bacterium]